MKAIISDNFRKKLHTIIYEADTPAGKFFDIMLLVLIIISIAAVMLESVASIKIVHGHTLAVIEWIITIFFTIEYIGRIIAVKKPWTYILSFYGIIDFLSMIPKYIGLIFPGTGVLLSVRAFRLLRIFRILKLTRFVGASNQLKIAVLRSRTRIAVFLFTVVVLCIILGTIMYLIEGPSHGFSSIPVSVYWTIVTLTTVGFGDITPGTAFGQFLSMVIMILGYGIIVVPTSLVTSELIKDHKVNLNTQVCHHCGADHHRDDAKYCFNCGTHLH